MTDLVESVASIIFNSMHCHSFKPPAITFAEYCEEYADLHQLYIDRYRDTAREMIARIDPGLLTGKVAIVPLEPTPEMIEAAIDRRQGPDDEMYAPIYRAMVKAAQKIEGEPATLPAPESR